MKTFYRLISSFILLLFLLPCIYSCKTDKSNIGVTDGETITIVDHLGYEVTVPKNIDRIVIGKIYPLPSVVSIFFDSAEKIVGMPEQCMSAAKNSILSELYPEILNAKTDYINGANLNIESLIELEPDVFIYNAADVAHGELCRRAGIPAVAVAVNKWDYDAVLTEIAENAEKI